jgi:hypothetical protein
MVGVPPVALPPAPFPPTPLAPVSDALPPAPLPLAPFPPVPLTAPSVPPVVPRAPKPPLVPWSAPASPAAPVSPPAPPSPGRPPLAELPACPAPPLGEPPDVPPLSAPPRSEPPPCSTPLMPPQSFGSGSSLRPSRSAQPSRVASAHPLTIRNLAFTSSLPPIRVFRGLARPVLRHPLAAFTYLAFEANETVLLDPRKDWVFNSLRIRELGPRTQTSRTESLVASQSWYPRDSEA